MIIYGPCGSGKSAVLQCLLADKEKYEIYELNANCDRSVKYINKTLLPFLKQYGNGKQKVVIFENIFILKEDTQHYDEWLLQKTIFSDFIKNSRAEFETLYKQEYDAGKMQVEKEILIAEMRRKFTNISSENKYIARYSKWMSGPLNNAQLGAISLYREFVPAFRKIFRLCENDFEKFYSYVAMIAKLPEKQRETTLHATEVCQ